MPGNMFPSQQTPAGRGGPLQTGRLQGGKLGHQGWGFTGQMAGAPGLTGMQSRAGNTAGLSSFAQTIGGGSQAHTPLDPSEFPSLSGTPQTHHQNNQAQAIWSNPNIRTAQHTPVQRPQGQGATPQPPSAQVNRPPPQEHQQQPQDEPPSAHSPFGAGMDDYRFGGQAGVGQLSGAPQQQQQVNIEEFPPLGGAGGGDIGQDRRTGMIQNAAYGGGANAGAYMHQGRNGMSSPANSTQGSVGAGGDARSPHATLGGGGMQTIMRDADRVTERRAREASNASYGSQPVEPPSKPEQGLGHTRLSQMSEIDRFGLPGLLAMIPPESADHSSLAIGQDLTVLGLDLNRPDNSPLYPSFGSPFAEPGSRPVVPDFALPAAYTVTNVPPLHTKMSSFSDETLFAIFYQYPRDILQEIAAGELFNRDWRWHKELRQWMMKDTSFPAPQRMSEKQERGCYIFFDVNNWRRERRELLLNYDHLDQRIGTAQPNTAL
ncbi:uncharacterized protein K452DRAFT_284654 [Aplosporella prunicola CBS 121167]|uniref:NOT2/NOT3/NOT5 C-terminal domain-containing protein n=1 Tax=Aplosporella prunicola CBS 121167 TaxID=1176127 RepID=A0A6A6BP98_9PEZI|nr:uncharacterized protein K452DRAFT_284654 [Aplosporella prunicola CBS 121167]KAF2145273.1 hypothetical protein K452DRAFT_284654 [Aplosporella prunicola CBS 121167]